MRRSVAAAGARWATGMSRSTVTAALCRHGGTCAQQIRLSREIFNRFLLAHRRISVRRLCATAARERVPPSAYVWLYAYVVSATLASLALTLSLTRRCEHRAGA